MHGTDTYQVTIRIAPAQVVAALPHSGDYQEIGHTFERLTALAAGQGLMGPTSRSFGIYYDDPKVTALDQLRSDACVTVPDTWKANGALQRRELRAGRYAVILHVGPYAELHRAYDWLFGAWLSTSGEEAADAPCLEEYLNDPRSVPPTEWKTEIWLPLK